MASYFESQGPLLGGKPLWTALGYRSNEALIVFFGVRVALAIGLFAILALPIVVRPNVFMALGGAALGYMLPAIWLRAWGRIPVLRSMVPALSGFLSPRGSTTFGLWSALN